MTVQLSCNCDCHDSDALMCNKCMSDLVHVKTKVQMHRKLLAMYGKEWYEKSMKIKYAYMEIT